MDTKSIRNTHFNLGKHFGNVLFIDNPASIYKRDYPPKRVQQQVYIDKVGIKKSHLNIGKKVNQPCMYETMQREKYKQWKLANNALEEDKKLNLKGHHFKFGNFDNMKVPTQNQFEYTKKSPELTAKMDSEAQKQKMRMHYHDFKQGPPTTLTTLYQQYYTPKQPIPGTVFNPQEIYQKNKALRDSNIMFGKQSVPYLTNNGISYTPKQAEQNKMVSKPFYASNISLGNKGAEYQTTNLQYHRQFPIQLNKVNQQTKNQIRGKFLQIATHFTMGGAVPNYQTQIKTNFVKYPIHKNLHQFKNLQKNNFSLGKPDAKLDPTTTYNIQMIPRKADKQKNQVRQQNMDRGSHFAFGNEKGPLTTQFQAKFILIISYLPKSKSYDMLAAGVPTKNDNSYKDGLNIGVNSVNYTTTMKNDFKGLSGRRNDLGEDMQRKLRQGSIKVSDSNPKGITQYMDEYRKDQSNKLQQFHCLMFGN